MNPGDIRTSNRKKTEQGNKKLSGKEFAEQKKETV